MFLRCCFFANRAWLFLYCGLIVYREHLILAAKSFISQKYAGVIRDFLDFLLTF